jgi:hypothetical protein
VRTFFPRPVGLPADELVLTLGRRTRTCCRPRARRRGIEIPTETGDRVTGLNFTAFGDGAVDCTFTVYTLDSAHVATNLCTFNDVNRAAAWGLAQLTRSLRTRWHSASRCSATVSANAANYRLSTVA